MSIPIEKSNHYHAFRLYFRGITYDNDYGEYIVVFVDFPSQALLNQFRLDFLEYCQDRGLIDTSAYHPHQRMVGFRELETSLNNNPDREWRNLAANLLLYDSGDIYIDDYKSVEITMNTTVREL